MRRNLVAARLVLMALGTSLAIAGYGAARDLQRASHARDSLVEVVPPISSALRVFPPLGSERREKGSLDSSLIDSVVVSVCRVRDSSACEPIAEFTGGRAKGGHGSIRLQGQQYHVNWKVPKERSSRSYEVQFSVAGLELGSVPYEARGGRTLPVKFSIADHPVIRARVLYEQGQSASQVADRLLDEFSLGALASAQILSGQGFDAAGTATALRDVFGIGDPLELSQILARSGYPAVSLAEALRDVLGLGVLDVAAILQQLGYPRMEIAEILQEAFDLEAVTLAQLLEQLGFPIVEIAAALRDSFGLDALGVATVLRDLGADVLEVGKALRDVFELAALDAFDLLRNQLGYSEEDSQQVLLEVYGTYAAIVDVKVTRNIDAYDLSPEGEGYTAVSFLGNRTCTEPYVVREASSPLEAVLGLPLWPSPENQDFDVNRGIGGDFVIVWAKYALVATDAATEVLTGVEAKHWEAFDPPTSLQAGWQVRCPDGWTPEDGLTGGPLWDLALTTRAKSSCWRMGLCVRYEPFNVAETFISNLSLSFAEEGWLDACPAWCESNLGAWPMRPDRGVRTTGTWFDQLTGSGDIHRGCGGKYVRLCYDEARKWPAMPRSIGAFDDDEKRELLVRYAPMVYLPANLQGGDAEYFPAPVEWVFTQLRDPTDPEKGVVLRRQLECFGTVECEEPFHQVIPGWRQWTDCTSPPDRGPFSASCQWLAKEERWWLYPNDLPGSPSARLPFYYGCNRDHLAPCSPEQMQNGSCNRNDDCGLSDVPVYGFWHAHPRVTEEGSPQSEEVLDLVYFLYFPYNRGHSCANTRWENHVGDWETLTVRLSWRWDEQQGWSLEPEQVHMGAHHFGHRRKWNEPSDGCSTGLQPGIEKEGGTHPVAHVATGTHALWPDCSSECTGACSTEYLRIGASGAPICRISDTYARDVSWQTWRRIEAFDWSARRGLGLLVEGQPAAGQGFCATPFGGPFEACDEHGWPNWLVSVSEVGNEVGNEDPWTGPIFRWGTDEFGCDDPFGGACRMTKGPSGPVDKGLWTSDVVD